MRQSSTIQGVYNRLRRAASLENVYAVHCCPLPRARCATKRISLFKILESVVTMTKYFVFGSLLFGMLTSELPAEETKRLLILGQGPDGHPRETHEYLSGATLVAKCLKEIPALETQIVNVQNDWLEGPQLLKEADGVFMFLAEGAKWIQENPRRYDAFTQLAARGGGLVVLHWGMGTREAKNIDGFVRLFGACHGGPDRRYKVVETRLEISDPAHPVVTGVSAFDLREEFYFKLKRTRSQPTIMPILQANIENNLETVGWVWQRPDGGRSCGYSGGHFHDNWRHLEYRRLISQAILWSLDLPIPATGIEAKVAEADFVIE